MDIRYQTKDIEDIAAVTVAKCQLPIFGRWSLLEITAYSALGGTAINFTCNPLDDDLRAKDWPQATTKERHLRIDRKTDDGAQILSQHITFNTIQGVVQHWTELQLGGVEAGRTLARTIMAKSEAMVETIRQSIRFHISGEVRKPVLAELHRRYHQITSGVVEQLLREINWGLMLRRADCDDDTMNVLVASLDGRNTDGFDTYPIVFDGDTGIETIEAEIHLTLAGIRQQRAEAERQIEHAIRDAKRAKANELATALLRNVCGATLADEFDKTGSITFSKNEYVFKMAPGGFLDCCDPNGKFTRLCIHTVGFACNPIDEIVFAYLNIRNKFEQYMATAIYHGADKGFLKPGVTV